MPPIVLKIEGNESFLPFSNLDQDELSKTWRVCTKVKDSLENGSRLENLSWRLWFIQNVVSNDVKSRSRYQKWSKKTTQTMELEKELEPTQPSKQQHQLNETPQSVLDYSLDEIKPVGTENFILNQFTSDQEGDLMIELQDIFPVGMQDFIYNAPSTAADTEKQSGTMSTPTSWAPNNQTYTSNEINMDAYPSTTNVISYASPNTTTPAATTTTINTTTAASSVNNSSFNSGLYIEPISGIHSLFADHTDIPSLTIPSDINPGMSNYQQMQHQTQPLQHQHHQHHQHDLVVDYNNAAYVAAAAAATAAALTTLPNATLHNKLLATLPPQTLASAERLLSPVSQRFPHQQQQQQQQQPQYPVQQQLQQGTHRSSPLNFIPNNSNKFVKPTTTTRATTGGSPKHFYNTFQLNPNNNSLSPATNNNVSIKKKSQTSTVITTTPSSSPSSSYSPSASPPSNSIAAEEPTPVCSNCEATSTPLWRRSADDKLLCNACGLYLKLHNAPRPKHLNPANTAAIKKHEANDSMEDATTEERQQEAERQHQKHQQQQQSKTTEPHVMCSNCGTIKTPLWRRDADGAPLCNACGLYLKLHNEKRPLSMKTDVIKKRQRTEALIASSISDDQSKKPRYYDQQALYSLDRGSSLGYINAASSLPGTGILMMTTNNSSNHGGSSQKLT